MRSLVVASVVMCVACSCPPKNGASTTPLPPETPTPPSARAPAVPAEDPLYARVEGVSFKNDCATDGDCHRGGCSSEICSAEEAVNSTCEARQWPQAGASCGCVAGQCVWYRAAGAAGPAGATEGAKQGEPCPDGKCAPGLSCIEYYGIAGPSGPKFSSCEIRCGGPGASCPAGQVCTTIADGPGQVCQPK